MPSKPRLRFKNVNGYVLTARLTMDGFHSALFVEKLSDPLAMQKLWDRVCLRIMNNKVRTTK